MLVTTLTSEGGGYDYDPTSSFSNPIFQIRYVLITFLQNLFYKSPLPQFKWDVDDAQTRIYITSENVVKASVLQKRPCITLTRAPLAYAHMGFDDMRELDMRTGKKTRSVLLPGTMAINCCARADMESEHIAAIVAEHIWALRDVLLKRGFYDIGRNITINSPSGASGIVTNEGGDEWYCTTAIVPYQFHRTATITPLNTGFVEEIAVRMEAKAKPIPAIVHPTGKGNSAVATAESAFPQVGDLTKMPHPLNPAKTVTVTLSGSKIKPPWAGVGNLPITTSPMGHSNITKTSPLVTKVKV